MDLTPINNAGTFRGEVVEYYLKNYESGSVALYVKVAIYQGLNDGVWEDWGGGRVSADGFINVVKKDKTMNKKSVLNIIKSTGWDGSFASIESGEFKPYPVKITVKKNSYEGNITYPIAYLNHYEGMQGNSMNQDEVNALDTMFGADIRAMAGNIQINKPACVKHVATEQPEPSEVDAKTPSGEDIPF